MSWLFSQALVEGYSPGKFSDGEQSVPSNGKPTQRAYLQRDKTTDTWSRFPSGMTCEPLTESDGEAVLTLFLAAFPVRTSVQQEKELESKVNDPDSGWKWPESSVKYDPNLSMWKTRQCSLLGGLEPYSETWPQWGSMRDGECWEQPMWVPHTNGTESGLWVTPTAKDAHPWTGGELYQTSTGSVRAKNPDGSTSNRGLEAQVTWPTARSTDGSKGQRTLEGARRELARGKNVDLGMAVKLHPTPQASDNRDRGNLSSACVKRRMKMGKQISLSQSVSTESGQLNPPWVEWLMGWPLGWTDLKPLATDKFREWLQAHGGF